MVHWAQDIYNILAHQFEEDKEDDLFTCDPIYMGNFQEAIKNIALLDPATKDDPCSQLDSLVGAAYSRLSARKSPSTCWRRLYTDASIFRALAGVITLQEETAEETALACIGQLDRAIIVAGPCGDDRLELILGLITRIQQDYLKNKTPSYPHSYLFYSGETSSFPIPSLPPTFSKEVPRLLEPPSFSAFISQFSHQPFVIPGFVKEWPASGEHPWNSPAYLRSVAGPGRIVPVEVGSDYREDDWSQTLMSWDQFLSSLVTTSGSSTTDRREPPRQVVLYLAQHNVFAQFPRLRDDIIPPDYVYASLEPPDDYPSYKPPPNDDQLVINAWLGPRGTVSPGHTDPFFNFYAQVVGRKTVWLAPPSVTPFMYPYPPPSSDSSQVRNPAANNTDPDMSNTTRVDVFSPESSEGGAGSKYPLFWEHAVHEAMCVTLEPGDLLFFPPGWWHALRSESTSFSVSMWF